MFVIEINYDNVKKRKEELINLFETENFQTNFLTRNFIGVIDNKIVAFAALEKSQLYIIDNNDNDNKDNDNDNIKINEIYRPEYFEYEELLTMYNFVRLKDDEYKGIAKQFIDGIYNIVKVNFYFATIIDKLYIYYLNLGFKETKYFDICTKNYFRRCFSYN
jgi:hypothetical protein